MIFHLSISAERPQHVAEVIAELWRGKAYVFPPFGGSWIAFAGDERNSAVEVYPLGQELKPGKSEVEIGPTAGASTRSATHMAIATPLAEKEVHAIGAREGWTCMTCNRGPFRVIELWVENRLLIEVLTDEMQNEYLGSMTPENWVRWVDSGELAG